MVDKKKKDDKKKPIEKNADEQVKTKDHRPPTIPGGGN